VNEAIWGGCIAAAGSIFAAFRASQGEPTPEQIIELAEQIYNVAPKFLQHPSLR
jgi:hypothetical protein